MCPRKYDMSKRSRSVEETRQRIIEATIAAHGELGMLETTYQDVAARADVALGTVHRHFPTVEDLVDACGRAFLPTLALPTPSDAADRFRNLASDTDRIERLAHDIADIYDRALPVFLEVRRASTRIAAAAEGLRAMEASIDALVDEALLPLNPTADQRSTVRALADARFWDALCGSGLNRQQIRATAARLLQCALKAR
ncbi:MAG TPA: TetR/AcrR family transcriptional regulator [Solirubrobacteraceae bacterium]|nr:TetR/AcrR family transcriptional regulator [Solirubrobacteraceae bacterium]